MTSPDRATHGARPRLERPVLTATMFAPAACFVGLVMMFGIAMSSSGDDEIINTASPMLRLIPAVLFAILGSLVASWLTNSRSRNAAKTWAWVSIVLSVTVVLLFGWMLA